MNNNIKKTQIVVVAAYYPPHLGGLERVAQLSAEELARRGYKIRVITSDVGLDKKSKSKIRNLKVVTLKSFELAHTPFAPTLFWHLLRLPKKSLIHLHLAQIYYPELVYLVAKIKKIPYIVHFHLDVGPSGFFGSLFMFYKKLFWGTFLRNAKKVIPCSPDQISVLINKYHVLEKNIYLIENAVSKDFFSSNIRTEPNKIFRLLYIGRLTVQKRVERLLMAMSLIKSPAFLTIVGEGEDRKKLESLAKKLNLNNVVFAGQKNNADMQKYHSENDLFLISSDWEGAALVILEAMAGKLPILGTNVAGVRDLLENVGVLVEEPYSENIAKKIDELWQKPKQLSYLSSKSYEKAKLYAWDRFANQLESVYKEVLQ